MELWDLEGGVSFSVPPPPQEQWLGAAVLPPPQFGPSPKLPPPEVKAKRRPLLLHNDPSILGRGGGKWGGQNEVGGGMRWGGTMGG